ncbi:hypothetical protein MTR67_030672 [Solanum verrucosum]|uniref:Uncharacterized protein n=1 Tax=Solanum verrucosum TaxID=315347 RepID=A0AAF0R6F0_SOLVR|nr:hypothetical protein MTR67_030672 [Solanum verrucosum]
MQILRSCRCNLRSPSTDRRSDHDLCWWTVVHHCNPSPASSENWLSLDPRTDPRSVDQTTVRGLCPWIKTSFTQPLTRTTVDQYGPSFDPRSVGLTVDRSEALSGRLDLRTQSMDRRLIDGQSGPSVTPTAANSRVFWSFPISRIRTLKGEKKSRTLVQERSKFPSVPAPKSKDFSMEFVTRYVGFH